MDPSFLGVADILRFHEDQLANYGGSPGVRDMGLLESAAAMPKAGFGDQYLHADLFEMAAAYLYHIVQNHPFVDGNKRTGTVTALAFLELNGIETDIDNDELETLVRSVAEGKADKPAISALFREHSSAP